MISIYPRLLLTTRWAFLIILLTGLSLTGRAQQKRVAPAAYSKLPATDPLFKIGTELAALQAELSTTRSLSRMQSTNRVPTNRHLLQISGNQVVLEALAESSETQQLLADLQALGMTQTASFGRMVSGLIPIAALPQVAALKSLHFARPAYKPLTKIGQVTSQGDLVMYADSARAKQLVTGRGSKIGVLSDSYNYLKGADSTIRNGELPGSRNPNGYKTPVQVLQDYDTTATDEGRGMLEIIHDVAPGAKLAFHTVNYGQANFARGILALQEAGCNIITDDALYLDEPMFQDGIIAQAVDVVKRKGATYFTSAGNNGRDSYEAAYKAGGPTRFGSKFIPGGIAAVNAHNFAPDDQKPDLIQQIYVPVGASVVITMQYSQPFYSVSTDGRGAESDLDIYLLTEDTTNIVGGSVQYNVGGDPSEVMGFTNNGSYGSNLFNILIDKVSGPAPAIIKYIIFKNSNAVRLDEYNTRSSTIYGHHNAAGAITTGAVFFLDTPAYGTPDPIAESFSSVGGTPILFDTQGNRQNAVVRQKPDIMAPDGVNTSFFGQRFGDLFYFFGTSAAAPHVAAVAALMQESGGDNLKPNQIDEALRSTALDMNTPGFDFETGYGFINAFDAIETVAKPRIRHFTLVNAENGRFIRNIREGDVINLTRLPTRHVLIRAHTGPARVGSVVLKLNGKEVTENIPPYDYPGTEDILIRLDENNYTITATPYTKAKGQGEAGIPLTVSFKAAIEEVVRFELINVTADTVIRILQNGDFLYRSELPAKLNIRAITSAAPVGSVQFNLNDKVTTENISPYEVAGSSGSSLNLPDGLYTLSATTFAAARAQGTAGNTTTMQFVVFSSPGDPDALPDNTAAQNNSVFSVMPNPFAQTAKLRFTVPETGNASLTVYDLNGASVAELHNGLAQAGQLYEYTLDGASLPAGWYIGRVITDKGIYYQKLRLTK